MCSNRIHHCQTPTALVSAWCGSKNRKKWVQEAEKSGLITFGCLSTRFPTPQGVNFQGFVRSPVPSKEASARLLRDQPDAKMLLRLF